MNQLDSHVNHFNVRMKYFRIESDLHQQIVKLVVLV